MGTGRLPFHFVGRGLPVVSLLVLVFVFVPAFVRGREVFVGPRARLDIPGNKLHRIGALLRGKEEEETKVETDRVKGNQPTVAQTIQSVLKIRYPVVMVTANDTLPLLQEKLISVSRL